MNICLILACKKLLYNKKDNSVFVYVHHQRIGITICVLLHLLVTSCTTSFVRIRSSEFRVEESKVHHHEKYSKGLEKCHKGVMVESLFGEAHRRGIQVIQ